MTEALSVDIKSWAYAQAQEWNVDGVVPLAAVEMIIEKMGGHYQGIIHMIEESKKCRQCEYVAVCHWSRGEDDESCGKFIKKGNG